MGGIGEDPPKRYIHIPRVRASFCSTLGAGTSTGGGGKVVMFIRSIVRKERTTIRIILEDKDGANGFMKDWAEVERV
mgnify:CR=1 FL=1